jgi:hypothetical protein
VKRKHHADTQKYAHKTGNIRKDLKLSQLAGIGAVALAYTEAEAAIDQMFFAVTGLTGSIQIEVGSRINCDQKIEIVKEGAKILGASATDLAQISEALAQGEGYFGRLKSYRDAVVHCRVINASIGIGIKVGWHGTLSDVLLTEKALDWAYDSLIQLSQELTAGANFLLGLNVLHGLASDDPNRASYEAKKEELMVQFRGHRDRRLALPPAPEFPSALELHEAATQWQQARQAEQMGWYRQLSQPLPPRGMSAAVMSTTTGTFGPPFPLINEPPSGKKQ